MNAHEHHLLANQLSLKNDYQGALKHYRKALHQAPDLTIAHYNLGLLLLKHHELEAARKQFNNVITLYPDHMGALFYLGVLHLNAQELDEAERAFKEVLTHAEDHVFSLTNLGVIALKRKEGQRALDYFTKALGFDPNHIEARNNMAATFIHHDRFENALTHYEILLQHDPVNLEYHYNSGVAQMSLGHLPEAIAHFEAVLTQQETHFASLTNLAAIHMRLNHRQTAIALLERARIANPHDKTTPFMLHALTGDDTHPASCPEYVNQLFDHYALNYDKHMQETLNYTLPHHISRVLHQLNRLHFERVIDLGCGTGLSGSVLRESSEHLLGVDLSTKMLAEARRKAIYDDLVESDLSTFLHHDPSHYDLMVASDVLPYSGALEPLFETLTPRLNAQGLFMFSIEISPLEPWALQASARFCHHPNYIKTLCHANHLQLIHQEPVVARRQEGSAVNIMLLCAKKG